MILLLAVGISLNLKAQKSVRTNTGRGGGFRAAPRVIVAAPVYRPFFYQPFGYGYGLYNRFGYQPFMNEPMEHRPSKLTIAIQDIENDYADKITSVRADDTLSGKERRAKIRELRNERDEEVNNTKKNYYKE